MADKDLIREPVCYRCKNYILWPYCFAFPDGIPQEIRDGEDDHSQPVEGDHGLRFELINGRSAVERGGPGSGHFGHEGRPGERGGSQPGDGAGLPSLEGITWRSRPRGGNEFTEFETLEEALEFGDGRIELIDDDRLLWASVVFARNDPEGESEFFRAGYTRDEIDPEVEIQHMIGVYDHLVEVLSDPDNAEFIRVGDREGESMLRVTQAWLERMEQEKAAGRSRLELLGRRGRFPGLNMIVTNRSDNVGAGSTSVGALGGKVFWGPVTLAEDRQVLSDTVMTYGVSGPYVLTHELHHGFGSGTELDSFSDVVGADYYIRNPEAMSTAVERSMNGELNSRVFSGTRRASGDAKDYILRDRANMGWLYSRNSDYFDQVFTEVREYEATGEVTTERARNWTWAIDDVEKKLRQWAKEYG